MSHSLSIAVFLLLLVTGVQAVHPGATATQELSKQAIGYKTSPDNYHILYRSTSLEGAWRPIRMKLGGDGPEDVMRDTVPIKHRAFYRVLSLPLDEPRDTDADGLTDVEELELSETQHPLNAAIVAESHGAAIITSREQYERLARRDSVPGASNIREMKFLITDIDTNSPKLHLIDTTRHQFHVYFYWFALGNHLDLQQSDLLHQYQPKESRWKHPCPRQFYGNRWSGRTLHHGVLAHRSRRLPVRGNRLRNALGQLAPH